MKVLLINPETPCTFWSFRNALKFVSKKSSEPPLGLLTVAALLPKSWQKKLIAKIFYIEILGHWDLNIFSFICILMAFLMQTNFLIQKKY